MTNRERENTTRHGKNIHACHVHAKQKPFCMCCLLSCPSTQAKTSCKNNTVNVPFEYGCVWEIVVLFLCLSKASMFYVCKINANYKIPAKL